MQKITFPPGQLICYGLQSHHDEMLPGDLLALVLEWRLDRSNVQNLSKIQEHVKLECNSERCGWFVGYSLLVALTKEAPSLWWIAALWNESARLALRVCDRDPTYAELAAIELTATLKKLYDHIVAQEGGEYTPNLEERRLASSAFDTLERLSQERALEHSIHHLKSILPQYLDRPPLGRLIDVLHLPSYLLYRLVEFQEIPWPDTNLRSHFAFLRIEKDARRLYPIVTGLVHFLVVMSTRAFNLLVLAEIHLSESRPNLLQALRDTCAARRTRTIRDRFHKYLALLETRVDTRYLEALEITREMLEQAKSDDIAQR